MHHGFDAPPAAIASKTPSMDATPNNDAPKPRPSTTKLKPSAANVKSSTTTQSTSTANPKSPAKLKLSTKPKSTASSPKTTTKPKPAAASDVKSSSGGPKPTTRPKPAAASDVKSSSGGPKTTKKPKPAAALDVKSSSGSPKTTTKPKPAAASDVKNSSGSPKTTTKPKPVATNPKPTIKPKDGAANAGASAPNSAKPSTTGVKRDTADVKTPGAADSKPNATIQTVSAQLGKSAVWFYTVNVEDLTSFTDEVHQKAVQSIEDAEKAMSKARGDLEKAKASKEDRNNVVSKANEVASTLLAPGRQAVHLLAGHGVLFPPCKEVSKALAVRVSSSPSDTPSYPYIAYADADQA